MTTLNFAQYVYSFGAANTKGVCLGNDGNVWAASNGPGIWKTTPAGVITGVGGLTAGQSVTWVCQGSDGYIYGVGGLGGGGTGSVWKVDPTLMTFTQYTGGPYYTAGCCTGPDGNVWITTDGGNTVYKFDITAHSFTGYTLGGSGFYTILSHGGYLWLSDNSGALVRLDTSGGFTRYSIGTTAVRSLCVDTSGDFWLGGTDIYRVTSTGTVLTHIASVGTQIIGCIQASDGNVYFGDSSGPAMYQVVPGASSATTVMTTGEIGSPWGVCIGGDSNMWWADAGNWSDTWKVGINPTGNPIVMIIG